MPLASGLQSFCRKLYFWCVPGGRWAQRPLLHHLDLPDIQICNFLISINFCSSRSSFTFWNNQTLQTEALNLRYCKLYLSWHITEHNYYWYKKVCHSYNCLVEHKFYVFLNLTLYIEVILAYLFSKLVKKFRETNLFMIKLIQTYFKDEIKLVLYCTLIRQGKDI